MDGRRTGVGWRGRRRHAGGRYQVPSMASATLPDNSALHGRPCYLSDGRRTTTQTTKREQSLATTITTGAPDRPGRPRPRSGDGVLPRRPGASAPRPVRSAGLVFFDLGDTKNCWSSATWRRCCTSRSTTSTGGWRTSAPAGVRFVDEPHLIHHDDGTLGPGRDGGVDGVLPQLEATSRRARQNPHTACSTTSPGAGPTPFPAPCAGHR